MKLEDLVPPLELCKQIPDGAFADSALVWEGSGTAIWQRGGKCYWHQIKCGTEMFPAPTLQEIMVAIYDLGSLCPTCWLARGWWEINTEFHKRASAGNPDNPAAAALKLWLELHGEEKKNDGR